MRNDLYVPGIWVKNFLTRNKRLLIRTVFVLIGLKTERATWSFIAQKASVSLVAYLHVSAAFITKERSLGWSKTANRICGIHWEKRRIKHTQMKGKQCNLLEQFSYDLEMKTREQNRNNKRVETAIWLVYRTDTNARGYWLVKRTLGWKNFIPENFLEINRYFAFTSYCNTIGQSYYAFSILGFLWRENEEAMVFFIFSCISCSLLLRRFVFCKVEASDWLWAARETPTLSFPPSFARAIETSGYEADRVYRELSRNQPILRFDVILQHDWPIELCLLLVRVSLAGKRRSHVLIFSSIGW